jgi:acetylornithine deacetylase/succinyl-diaminopimelate desuccinylase-like protein
MTDIDRYIDERGAAVMSQLTEFLRIPSISTSPEHTPDCQRAAKWLADHLEALGCRNVGLIGGEEHPVVWAESPEVPGKPTVLVYGHYDVQPPDPVEEWESPPFEPTVRDGNIYARGATDDKGQMFSIIKAFEAVSASGPPVNVRFMLEGEEESGGGVLTELLRNEPERVVADAVLVADMPYFAPKWPAVYTALRGLCYCEISVRTSKTDLHSGLYGGVAPNAHQTLVRILAGLKSPKGRIKVPGLYEAVEPPTKEERKAWRKLPFKASKYLRDELGAKAMTGLEKFSPLERTWALPTFDIHGIVGGFVGEGAKTVIPAQATAKVSLRLVPNQRAKTVFRQLRKAVKELAPSYATVSVRFIHGADPVKTDVTAAPVRLISEVFKEVEGREAVPIRSGGSIPIVPALAGKGAPVVLAGVGLPDDRLHAPNEKLAVEQFWKGVRVFGRFFQRMGELGEQAS